jgi:hypothetical protein
MKVLLVQKESTSRGRVGIVVNNQVGIVEMPEAMAYGLNSCSVLWIHQGHFKVESIQWTHQTDGSWTPTVKGLLI